MNTMNSFNILEAETIKKWLDIIKRKEDANKNDHGHMLVCAGTLGMAGAAVMCGQAALKSGCGLLTFYVEREIIPVLQISVPQGMCVDISKNIDYGKYDSIAAGPGLVSNAGEYRLESFLNEYDGKLVIDAASLNVIAEKGCWDVLKKAGKRVVMTPHEGEMARLLGKDSSAVKKDRIGAAQKLHEMTGCNIVLKGKDTIILGGDGACINPTGNPGMAAGGSGDVLTGMIAGFACQGMSAFEAACTGVYVHGLAGDIAAEKYGVVSMTALDIIKEIHAAVNIIIDY